MKAFLKAHSLAALGFLALAIGLFRHPLLQFRGLPHWDGLDVHATDLYAASNILREGFHTWTHAVFAGFPLLADIQTGIFYPFWLLPALFTHITPWMLFAIEALHYAIASFGMYLFVTELTKRRTIGVFAGVCYALSGQLVNHASHVGLVMTASWLPVALLLAQRLATKLTFRRAAWTGVFLGAIFLIGHFQTFLYLAVAFAAWFFFSLPKFTLKSVGAIALAGAFCVGIGAIQWLPSSVLVRESYRPLLTYDEATINHLEPRTLLTFLNPNRDGAVWGSTYRGQFDITQSNLYVGILPLVFALLGLVFSKRRRETLFFIALGTLAILYAFGNFPVVGDIAKALPIVNKLRGPLHALFLTEFSVIIIASLGLEWFLARTKPSIAPGIALLALLNLIPFTYHNKTLFEPAGDPRLAPILAPKTQTLVDGAAAVDKMREGWRLFGVPPFDKNFGLFGTGESLDGTNPLATRRSLLFKKAIEADRTENLLRAASVFTEKSFPLAFFAAHVQVATDPAAAIATFHDHFSSRIAVIEAAEAPKIVPHPKATVALVDRKDAETIFAVNAPTPQLLVFNESFFPGWTAAVNGKATPIFATNGIFQSIDIPGSSDPQKVVFRYEPVGWKTGILITSLTLTLALVALLRRRKGTSVAG